MNRFLVLTFGLFFLFGCQVTPKIERATLAPNFERAKQFSPNNLKKLVHNLNISANWVKNTENEFWFERYSEESGQEFIRVSMNNKDMQPLFNKSLLQQSLAQAQEIDWKTSPLTNLSLVDKQLRFDLNNQSFLCNLSATPYQCEQSKDGKSKVKKAENGSVSNYLSPDKSHYVQVKGYNLFLCKAADKLCRQLTHDGTEATPYAVMHPYPEQMLADNEFNEQQHLSLYWSEDSKYVITHKLFRAGVNQFTLTNSTANNDFNVKTVKYYYPQAGDSVLPEAQVVLIDVDAQQAHVLDAPKVMQTYYGGPFWGQWHNGHFYYQDRRRGNQTLYLRKVVAEDRKVVSLIKEVDPEFIDPWVQTLYYLDNSDRLIWSAQRSGYQHLYLYNATTGELLNPITQGDYTVRVIRGVDEKQGVLYFEASGKEPGRDPYLRHLYRVNLDGSNLTLLTPEGFEHDTRLSPDYRYFVDNYSDANTPTVSWIRSTVDGEKLLKLGEANITGLVALGWQAPEPFSVMADDGKTRLFGLIYKPTNFDENKTYPVINDTYTGPHNFFTPKSFATFFNQRPALAEHGFIVIKMDGRGTNKRGREFHRLSYKNLAAGTDDHVWAIKQLAKKHQYMDIDRVGIFGFSAGGYDTVQAMLRHNTFFKAGVSASGNHDFRVDKAGWNEIWMGWPTTDHWQQQSNYTDVERLQGKLLLAHGELDSNVHPSATMRLVDKLIEADKDFDLLIMPKMGHVLDNHPYYVNKRARFFIEHLKP